MRSYPRRAADALSLCGEQRTTVPTPNITNTSMYAVSTAWEYNGDPVDPEPDCARSSSSACCGPRYVPAPNSQVRVEDRGQAEGQGPCAG